MYVFVYVFVLHLAQRTLLHFHLRVLEIINLQIHLHLRVELGMFIR